jgi:hypothetical protein
MPGAVKHYMWGLPPKTKHKSKHKLNPLKRAFFTFCAKEFPAYRYLRMAATSALSYTPTWKALASHE